MELQAPQYINTAEQLQAWLEFCARAPEIAVDTESDSFHHYREKVCLIQMTALDRDALIDPLALPSMEPLRQLFADGSRPKIFHDAVYDLVCLRRDFGFEFAGLFDTMLASRFLGVRNFGLAPLLKERFAFEADKRMQRSDWAQRPLSDEQITYARFDTHFLPRLAMQLRGELETRQRLHWAMEDFARLPDVAARIQRRPARADPYAFLRLRGIKAMSQSVQGRVKALFELRERLAERYDRPPFRIFSDQVIVDLARRPPRDLGDLGPRPGFREVGISRFGRDMLQALREAKPFTESPPPAAGRRRRYGRLQDPIARQRYEMLRQVRTQTAQSLGLDPEVLLGNSTVEEFAREPPESLQHINTHTDISGWRQEVLARPLFEALGAFEEEVPAA